ncbi:MAG: aspartate kinase [Anaerolineae bacterium]|nr:aspartate kinase [Anaerolineae bacterium]
MATLVMKFGGSLTSDVKRLTRVAQVIMAESLAWKRMIVVVSAMAGATDTLSQAIEQAALHNAPGYRRAVAELRESHLGLLMALFPSLPIQHMLTAQLDNTLSTVLTTCDRIYAHREALPRDRDIVMATGEQMMVPIVTALVRQEGLQTASVNAESVMITDDKHQNAHPLLDVIDERVEQVIRPLLESGIVPIIAGFVGATKTGAVTTLGRGGSDYTATTLAASLRADEVWIWTTVDGVMSADPQLVPGARVIPTLSYEEVGELSYFGARVLHPRAVEPLQAQGIPLRVRNPFNLDHAGTLIQANAEAQNSSIKAVTAVDGLCLYTSGRPLDTGEFVSRIHRIVGRTVTGPVIVMQSHFRSVVVFVVPTNEGPNAVTTAKDRLSAQLTGWEIVPVKVITLMGTPGFSESALISPIRPLASAVGPGDRYILCVNPSEAQSVVRQLHKLTENSVDSVDQQVWPPTRS